MINVKKKTFLPVIVEAVLRINIIDQNMVSKAVERLHKNSDSSAATKFGVELHLLLKCIASLIHLQKRTNSFV